MTEAQQKQERVNEAVSSIEQFSFSLMENIKQNSRGESQGVTVNDITFALFTELEKNPELVRAVFTRAADAIIAIKENDEEVGK